MLLHKNKNEFKQIVSAVAEEFGLESFQVEKDYYVSLFLREMMLIDSDVQLVFKGGTSLSKCYDVIDRFSEDIDLAVKFNSEKLTPGKRKKLKQLIMNTIASLEMKLLNTDEVRSRRDYNEYQVAYDNVFRPDLSTVPHIIIETIVVYNPYPVIVKPTSNYITKYLTKNNLYSLIDKHNLMPFEMPIQTIERTFIDKLFALCDYHLQKKYHRYSRHIYDVHMIWKSDLLDMNVLDKITSEVIKDRQRYGIHNLSCQPGMKPGDILEEVIFKDVYEEDYKSITSTFLSKSVDYEVCKDTLKSILGSKILPRVIRKYD